MTQKERLAEFIRKGRLTPRDWRTFAKSNSFIRIKEVGQNGDVLINLSAADGWLRPEDWLINYTNQCKESFRREVLRLKNIIPQDEIASELNSCGIEVVSSSSEPTETELINRMEEIVLLEEFTYSKKDVFHAYRKLVQLMFGYNFEDHAFKFCVRRSNPSNGGLGRWWMQD